MHLYEVIYNAGREPDDDTDFIYLVRAHDHKEALELAEQVKSHTRISSSASAEADRIHEIGIDLTVADTPTVIHGPFEDYAYNRGWKSWTREFDDQCLPTSNWVEDDHCKNQSFARPEADSGGALPS